MFGEAQKLTELSRTSGRARRTRRLSELTRLRRQATTTNWVVVCSCPYS